MARIESRNDLIKWLEDNAPRPCIKRALVHGTNENLGGFGYGWIVRIWGKKQEWFVVVCPDRRFKSEYVTWTIEKIPWTFWEGDKSENPLYQGDFPEKYEELRNEKR